MTTLSEYNNNPGNIRPAKGVKYEGMIGVDDKGFAIFEEPKYGQQALINDLTHKIEKRGIKTPNDFVDVYTPKSDENSEDSRENYKIYLAQKLGLKSTHDDFPENAVNDLAHAVTNFEGGKWQETPKEAEQEAPAEGSTGEPIGDPIPASTAMGANETTPYAMIGAGAGAIGAGHVEAGKKVLPLLGNALDKLRSKDDFMYKPQSRQSLQRYMNSQIEPNLRIPLSELEKVAGEGKSIRTMSEVQDALKNIKGTPMERTGKTVSIDPTTNQPRKIYTTTPAKAPIDLSAYKYNPTMMNRAVDVASDVGGFIKGALPSVGNVGIGALGGALAGSQLYDAFKQYKEDGPGLHMPSARNAAQFASGVGGGLGAIPFPATKVIGAALQAPELAYQGYEGLKELGRRRQAATREDTDRMLMNMDAMGNPM